MDIKYKKLYYRICILILNVLIFFTLENNEISQKQNKKRRLKNLNVFVEKLYVSSNNFEKHHSYGNWLHQWANLSYPLVTTLLNY